MERSLVVTLAAATAIAAATIALLLKNFDWPQSTRAVLLPLDRAGQTPSDNKHLTEIREEAGSCC